MIPSSEMEYILEEMEASLSQLFPCSTSSEMNLQIAQIPPHGGEACLEAWSATSKLDPGRCSILMGIEDRVDRNVEILGLDEN